MDSTPAHPAEQGLRTTLIGILTNLLLAAVKAVAGFLGNAYVLIADAIESLTDVVSSLIVYFGLRVAARPPDENHPYGHGKAEPIAAIIVALLLFAAAVGIALQSVREIVTPHHAPAPFTLVVLLAVVIVKETLFRYVFKVGDEVESIAVKGDAWHHRSDALTSAAAFIGISVALLGGDGWEAADDWAALFASGIIGVNAYRIFHPALLELTDAAPDRAIEEQVRAIAAQVEGVLSLHQCRVRKIGFDYFVELDVVVDADQTVREGHRIAHRVQDAVRDAMPRVSKVLVHVEPPRDKR